MKQAKHALICGSVSSKHQVRSTPPLQFILANVANRTLIRHVTGAHIRNTGMSVWLAALLVLAVAADVGVTAR